MELSLEWQQIFSKYYDYVFIVEGKKDAAALRALGFQKVYTIHANGISLKERIEKIALLVGKKNRVCILTDFDKKGKQLYIILKRELQNFGVKMDNSLRKFLLIQGISHIEGLDSFVESHEL